MIGEEFVSRKPVTLGKVKEILKERKKEKDLTYEQDQAYKYASTFSKLTMKQQEKLFSELIGIDTINEGLAVKIIDILPPEIEIMKLIPTKEDAVTEEDLKKAFEIVSKYVKK